MIRRIMMILLLTFVITSCAGAAPAPTQAPIPAEESPVATEPPAFQSLEAPTQEPSTETATIEPSPTEVLPTPTDTPLPTLELPTEAANAPVRMVWDGTPTYLGDSLPGYSFRVTYDPDLWGLTTDQFGSPALAHRSIPSCIITPTAGRGLPPSMTVEHSLLNTGAVTFNVNTIFENGVMKFVTYTGGDERIITAFEVVFEEQVDRCLRDAVTVLSTLTSVPVSQATPQP